MRWISDRAWRNAEAAARWVPRTYMPEGDPGYAHIKIVRVAKVGTSTRVLAEAQMPEPYRRIKVEYWDDPDLLAAQARAAQLAETWNVIPGSVPE